MADIAREPASEDAEVTRLNDRTLNKVYWSESKSWLCIFYASDVSSNISIPVGSVDVTTPG